MLPANGAATWPLPARSAAACMPIDGPAACIGAGYAGIAAGGAAGTLTALGPAWFAAGAACWLLLAE